ncbi:MAG: hypothetical protein ACREJN_03025 [Nitrospiraceae bacterium]
MVAEDQESNCKPSGTSAERARYVVHLAVHGCVAVDEIACAIRHSADPVPDAWNQGISQLAVNINNLNKRLAELREMPDAADPKLRELHARDLPGWNLNQQQYLLQRNHLRIAISQLLREHFSRETAPA